MTQVLAISKLKKRLKLSPKDLFYIAIILGLVIALLYKITQTGFMRQEAVLLEEKNQVLDSYLRKLDQEIKNRQNQIANLDSTNQEQKDDLIQQLNFLRQKRKEILRLKKDKEVNYKKILWLTSAIDRQRLKGEKITQLQKRIAYLNNTVKELKNTDGNLEIPSWQYKFQNLQSSYQQLANENKNLKVRLSSLSGKVFATNIHSQPGEILRGKFDPSTRARRTSVIQLQFKLTRMLQQKEKLIIRLFDQNKEEFAIRPDYQRELTQQGSHFRTLHLKPAKSRRFRRGKNIVKLFVAHNGETKPIGIHSVFLR